MSETKLEKFMIEKAAKRAEQKARMAAAYNKNKKIIEFGRVSKEKRLENKYKKWAEENQHIVDEEIKSPVFENVWKNLVDNFR